MPYSPFFGTVGVLDLPAKASSMIVGYQGGGGWNIHDSFIRLNSLATSPLNVTTSFRITLHTYLGIDLIWNLHHPINDDREVNILYTWNIVAFVRTSPWELIQQILHLTSSHNYHCWQSCRMKRRCQCGMTWVTLVTVCQYSCWENEGQNEIIGNHRSHHRDHNNHDNNTENRK